MAEPFQCSHAAWEIVRNRWANGDYVFWRQCVTCGENIGGRGKWLTFIEADKFATDLNVKLGNTRIIDDYALLRPPCVVCGERGVELHHWAPKAIFGAEEADLWPTSWLCRDHHVLWHNKMRAGAPQQSLLDDAGRPF